MTFGKQFWQASGAVALVALVSTSAAGQVTTRLVTAGGSATSTKIIPGGTASIDVRIDAPAMPTTGTAFRLSQTAPVPNGFFSITARSFAGSPYNDPVSGTPDVTVFAPASALLDRDNNDNLGRSPIGLIATPGANNILAANLALTASGATPLGTYTIQPTAGLSFVTGNAPAFPDFDMSSATHTIVVGQTLTVIKSPVAGGTVVSDIGAINCGATCSDIYPGSTVTLTATASAGFTFTGWSGGGCSGTGTCVVTVTVPTTVTATFTDIAAPDTIITGTPTNPSSEATPTFTFISTEPGSTFECALDAAPFSACSSPTTVFVASGPHTFQVRAIDPSGNVDPTPASFTWLVLANVQIPALNEWMLVLLILLVGATGIFTRRRKN